MHPTEEKYPLQTKKFRELVDMMYDVHLKKNSDYSPSNILISGDIGVLTRMWDKLSRICNLVGLTFPAPGPLVQNLVDKIEADDNMSKADILAELDSIKEKCSWNFKNIEQKEPANEPLEDAYLDLANYSIIGLLHHQGKWGR